MTIQGLKTVICYCILAATIINGSVVWFRSVGLMDTNTHAQIKELENYFQNHAKKLKLDPKNYTDEVLIQIQAEYREYLSLKQSFLYTKDTIYVISKIAKYLVIFTLLLAIIYAAKFEKSTLNKDPIIIIWFVYFGLACLYTLLSKNWISAFAGVLTYCFSYLLILHSDSLLKQLSKTLVVSLIILLVMAPFEYFHGSQYFSTNSVLNMRLTGFMSQPSTLGIYVVCISALYLACEACNLNSHSKFYFVILISPLVILTGSYAALTCLFVMAMILLFQDKQSIGLFRLLLLFITLLALQVLIMNFLDRPALASLMGRVQKYEFFFSSDISITKLLLGHGVGYNSPALNYLSTIFPNQVEDLRFLIPTDSTPLILILQTGLIGCLIFYGLIINAMCKDKDLWPAYLVFILCSFTTNLTEIFPLNILLGLMLAKTYNGLTSTIKFST